MKKGLVICFILIMLVFSVAVVSAFSFGDLWRKITGEAVGDACTTDADCSEDYTNVYCWDDGSGNDDLYFNSRDYFCGTEGDMKDRCTYERRGGVREYCEFGCLEISGGDDRCKVEGDLGGLQEIALKICVRPG